MQLTTLDRFVPPSKTGLFSRNCQVSYIGLQTVVIWRSCRKLTLVCLKKDVLSRLEEPRTQGRDFAVDSGHQPVEQLGIQVLCQRIPGLRGGLAIQLLDDALAHSLNRPCRQRPQQVLLVDLGGAQRR